MTMTDVVMMLRSGVSFGERLRRTGLRATSCSVTMLTVCSPVCRAPRLVRHATRPQATLRIRDGCVLSRGIRLPILDPRSTHGSAWLPGVWSACMARWVQCIKLGREAEGLDYLPYPGELGKRIFASVSKQAWMQWLEQQKMLVNENQLNLADKKARDYLVQ
jgi:Fe-S cluster biosynthesis and repair protein YggX